MALTRLATGVPGLDEVLGGGLPEYSFNLVAGVPGSGKTTLVHQIVFANATEQRPALYFTALGEPSLKMLRYQQQMAFFDPEKVGHVLRFVDLTEEVLSGNLERVLERIVHEVSTNRPQLVVVDSLHTVVRAREGDGLVRLEQQGFLQRLGLHLTSWEVTSFLVGEYMESDLRDNPVFTVADAILWLFQNREGSSVVRRLQLMKLRGQASLAGLHSFRISTRGVEVFPRVGPRWDVVRRSPPTERLSTGVPGLDELLGGGLPAGDVTLVAGPSGTGKSMLCTHFLAEGTRRGEVGVLASFEEHPDAYGARTRGMGFDFEAQVKAGLLRPLYLRPLDLSLEEALEGIRTEVESSGARRLVIDSLSGLELALAPGHREELRDSLYRLVGALTRSGVTVMMTIEVRESFLTLSFSPHAVSFLTENILLLRHVEMEGRLRRVITVAKMRRSWHSQELRVLEQTEQGLAVGEGLADYTGIVSGIPARRERPARPHWPGLTQQEAGVLQVLQVRRQANEAQLAEATGLKRAELSRVLARLVALDYALRLTRDGERMYRVLARNLGQ